MISPQPAAEDNTAVHVQRVVITSDFVVGNFRATDAFSFRRNLCASPQELEFLKAVRLYFPNLLAHPNVPLRNFIDEDKVRLLANKTQRGFLWAAQVDVLLCSQDEDPIAGIELDSALHDHADAVRNDGLKNRLFKLANIPLIRIRPTAPTHVRAEDFYALLCNNADSLAELRPKRLRPRRSHDSLVPADGHTKPSTR